MIQLDTTVTETDEFGNEVKKTIPDPADAGHTVAVGDWVSHAGEVGIVVSVAGDRPSVSWLPRPGVAYVPLAVVRVDRPAPPAPVERVHFVQAAPPPAPPAPPVPPVV